MAHNLDHDRRQSPPHSPPAGPPLAHFDEAACERSCTRARKPMMSTASDAGVSTTQAQLLMQWLGGERRVSPPQVAHLYRKIYWRLYAGLGGHTTDAEDATQAAFLEAVKNRASIRKGLPEYVGGVGRMKLHEHYRRRGRHERTVSLTDLDDLPAEGVDASMVVEVALKVGRLVCALEQLPLDDQRCLALVYGRELRNVEAAALLSVSQVVFDNRLGHARARLRRVLERAEPTGAARRRSPQSFQEWVTSVLGPPGHDASEGSSDGNRFL